MVIISKWHASTYPKRSPYNSPPQTLAMADMLPNIDQLNAWVQKVDVDALEVLASTHPSLARSAYVAAVLPRCTLDGSRQHLDTSVVRVSEKSSTLTPDVAKDLHHQFSMGLSRAEGVELFLRSMSEHQRQLKEFTSSTVCVCVPAQLCAQMKSLTCHCDFRRPCIPSWAPCGFSPRQMSVLMDSYHCRVILTQARYPPCITLIQSTAPLILFAVPLQWVGRYFFSLPLSQSGFQNASGGEAGSSRRGQEIRQDCLGGSA